MRLEDTPAWLTRIEVAEQEAREEAARKARAVERIRRTAGKPVTVAVIREVGCERHAPAMQWDCHRCWNFR